MELNTSGCSKLARLEKRLCITSRGGRQSDESGSPTCSTKQILGPCESERYCTLYYSSVILVIFN